MADTDPSATGTAPFDRGNLAWQRFRALTEEHFDTFHWTDEHDRPRLVTLIDRASGHAVSLAPYDSSEAVAPAVVLVMSRVDASLTATGPYPGRLAADDAASQHALSDTTVAATCIALLHRPATRAISGWSQIPENIANRLWAPTPPETQPVVLLLINRDTSTMAVVGPFDNTTHARAHPIGQHTPQQRIDTFIIALN